MMQGRSRWVACSAAIAVVATACPQPVRAPREAGPAQPQLRLLTYNVNFGLAGDPAAVATIRSTGADVVLLQETTPRWEAAIREGLGDVYPTIAFVDRPAAGGMGILSRFPFEESEVLEPPAEGWFPAWRVEVLTPLGRVQLLNVHLHPQISDSGSVVSGYLTTGDNREAEIRLHASRLDPAPPTLIAGDFNEEAGGDAVEYLAGLGFRSALDQFSPGRETWRWQTSVGTVSFQFDHIVHDARLEPIDVRVLEAGRSDHLPVLATFVR
jgi:endonuclease/exonuclease/phosphatase (EEP) superfamily protein YafD